MHEGGSQAGPLHLNEWVTETVLGRLVEANFIANEEITKGFDKGAEMWVLWEASDDARN